MHSPFGTQFTHHLLQEVLPDFLLPSPHSCQLISDSLPVSVSLDKLLKGSNWVLFPIVIWGSSTVSELDQVLNRINAWESQPRYTSYGLNIMPGTSQTFLHWLISIGLGGRYHHLCFTDAETEAQQLAQDRFVSRVRIYIQISLMSMSMAFSKKQWPTRRRGMLEKSGEKIGS